MLLLLSYVDDGGDDDDDDDHDNDDGDGDGHGGGKGNRDGGGRDDDNDDDDNDDDDDGGGGGEDDDSCYADESCYRFFLDCYSSDDRRWLYDASRFWFECFFDPLFIIVLLPFFC